MTGLTVLVSVDGRSVVFDARVTSDTNLIKRHYVLVWQVPVRSMYVFPVV